MHKAHKVISGLGLVSMFLCFSDAFAFMNRAKEYVSGKPTSHLIYSHGFGDRPSTGEAYANFLEMKSHSAPAYENELTQAPFYTQESQKTLLKDISSHVKQGKPAISNIGFSMGGGTVINLLDKLIDYEHNKDFFKGTDVTSATDAQKILDAINRGRQTFTKPALSMYDTNAIRMPTAMLSAATFAVLTTTAYYLWSRYINKQAETEKKADNQDNKDKEKNKGQKKEEKKTIVAFENKSRVKETLAKLGIVGLGGVAWYLLGDKVARGYALLGINWILPGITSGHFNPADTEPAEALKRVITSGKYTAPTLWHFSRNDEILPGQTEQKVRALFENKNPTHEIIFTDESHNELSRPFVEKLKEFHSSDTKK